MMNPNSLTQILYVSPSLFLLPDSTIHILTSILESSVARL
jgi:hypothetical protein